MTRSDLLCRTCPCPSVTALSPPPRNQALAWGGGGLLVLYLANGLINQVDRLPLLPQALQLVGFAFSSWFFFRYVCHMSHVAFLVAGPSALDSLPGPRHHAA